MYEISVLTPDGKTEILRSDTRYEWALIKGKPGSWSVCSWHWQEKDANEQAIRVKRGLGKGESVVARRTTISNAL